MPRKPRILYTETDTALIWGRGGRATLPPPRSAGGSQGLWALPVETMAVLTIRTLFIVLLVVLPELFVISKFPLVGFFSRVAT